MNDTTRRRRAHPAGPVSAVRTPHTTCGRQEPRERAKAQGGTQPRASQAKRPGWNARTANERKGNNHVLQTTKRRSRSRQMSQMRGNGRSKPRRLSQMRGKGGSGCGCAACPRGPWRTESAERAEGSHSTGGSQGPERSQSSRRTANQGAARLGKRRRIQRCLEKARHAPGLFDCEKDEK